MWVNLSLFGNNPWRAEAHLNDVRFNSNWVFFHKKWLSVIRFILNEINYALNFAEFLEYEKLLFFISFFTFWYFFPLLNDLNIVQKKKGATICFFVFQKRANFEAFSIVAFYRSLLFLNRAIVLFYGNFDLLFFCFVWSVRFSMASAPMMMLNVIWTAQMRKCLLEEFQVRLNLDLVVFFLFRLVQQNHLQDHPYFWSQILNFLLWQFFWKAIPL